MIDSIGAEIRDAVDARLREGGDDHFYGAWSGGKSGAGGHPAGKVASGGGGGSPAAQPANAAAERGDAWAQKAYEPWAGSLSDKERAAVEEYTSSSYESINMRLTGKSEAEIQARTGNDPIGLQKARDMAAIAGLDTALGRASLPEATTVWRGGSASQSMVESLKPGVVLARPGFTSTSLDRDMAKGFAGWSYPGAERRVLYRMDLPKGAHAAYLDAVSKSGTGEFEMLLARGVQFRVDKVSHDEGGWVDVHLTGLS